MCGFRAALTLALLALGEGAALEGRHRAVLNGQFAGGLNFKALTREEAHTLAMNSLADVIELLATTLKGLIDQGAEDKANWEEYSEWSDTTETEKNEFLQEQHTLVMENEAKLASNRAEVQKLTADLAALAKEIQETEKSIADLVEMRKAEHAQFEASLADVTKTIRAVTKASEILEGHYGASEASLEEIRSRVQIALTVLASRTQSATPENVRKLASLLQSSSENSNPDFLNADSSKYENYEKQGGAKGVLGMLDELNQQLTTQKADLISTENNAKREYEETKLAKDTELAHKKKVQAEKSAKKTECEAIIEECIATIDQAKKEIEEAKAYLELLLSDRKKFQKTYNERNALRANEQAATQAALDALQSVSAGAKETVGGASLLQETVGDAPDSLLQVAMTAQTGARLRRTFARLLTLGKDVQSPVLIQTAQRLRQDYMAEDQAQFFDQGKFGPVLKLLGDLIQKLEDEQNAETSQHEWCETEKSTSVTTKEEREKNIHALRGSIEEFTTSIEQLKSEVLELEAAIKRTEKETKEAIKIRKQENEAFLTAKADHEEVIHAIQVALEALNGQFGFIQISQKVHQKTRQPQPGGDMPFSEYASGEGGAQAAVSMLNDLLNKYSTALEDLIKDENAAQKAHEELLRINAQFIEDATNTKIAKTQERRGQIGDLADDKVEMKTNLIELHEVSKYLMDLRPSCDDIRSTYEERKKRRDAEISALKEALEVISDPTSMAD